MDIIKEDNTVEPRSLQVWRPLGEKQSRESLRSIEHVTTIGLHHSAVLGGFGYKNYTHLRNRFRKTTYHGIAAPQVNACFLQWHPLVRTSHGNGMNSYSLGFVFDHDSRFESLDPSFGIAALYFAITTWRDVYFAPIQYIELHSQHANKPHDPGNQVVRDIVIPVCETLGLTFRNAAKSGNGKAYAIT